jgi:hypothetical protein
MLIMRASMNGFEPPLLFLVFNRPALTARVFEQIRLQRPKRLFVAADGPRINRPGEAELCRQTRQIATSVDWPCEVTTLFRDQNLGCGRAVSEAITWFFGIVEEGIILEDDCLPHPDFFRFCATMLERYRDVPQIQSIAGTHMFPPSFRHPHACYFSKYVQIWGWATWRRVWQCYDSSLSSHTKEAWHAIIAEQCVSSLERGYWEEILQALLNGSIDTWDFQVQFMSWGVGGLHVIPTSNLISNLGYGADATHTNFDGVLAERLTSPLAGDLQAPVPIEIEAGVDDYIFYARFLEHLSQSWWLEQVLSPERKLGEARSELLRKDRVIASLEFEILEKRRQLRLATRALAEQSVISR